MFNFGELITVGYIYTAVAFVVSTLLITFKNLIGKDRHYFSILEYLNVNVVAALIVWLIGYPAPAILAVTAGSMALMAVAHRGLRNFTIAGRLLLVTYSLLSLFGIVWG